MNEITWDDLEFMEPPDEDPFDYTADAGEVAAQAVAAGRETVPLATLPEEFWGARQLFKDIRQAAHATMNSADAVLGAVLARAAAMVSPDVKFDSGRGPDGSLNQFVALVAPSGVGKSTAVRCADALVIPPGYLCDSEGRVDQNIFRDGVGLGTGEGMAEAYMGTAERDSDEIHRSGPNKGEPKKEKYRTQVRGNAFLYLDEGETLTTMMHGRQGTTIGATIRTAWSGDTLGQANAREETTRFISRGSYSMGMVIGYQPSAVMALLAEGGLGTPQRFLWMSAIDTSIPEDPPELPRPIALPLETGTGERRHGDNVVFPVRGVIQFPDWIKRKLRREHREKVAGERTVDELDSHAPMMLCKLAALLALLDHRMVVSDDDWKLAEMLWAVSCATRDRLIEFGRRDREAKEQQQTEAKVRQQEALTLASREIDGNIVRVARLIYRRVAAALEKGETPKRYVVKKNIGSDNKRYFDAALEHAKTMLWITSDDDDQYLSTGSAAPV